MIRIGILGSTRGSSMLPIIHAIQKNQLDAQINVVISNKPDAIILHSAAEHKIATQFINPQQITREEYDQEISKALHSYDVELVVLIGYMRILSDGFISEWENKIINVHPSLLPAFSGGIDLDVHRAVLEAGVNETGCTVHVVTEKVDAGPVLVQKICLVTENDTPASLKARVQALEGAALIEAIGQLNHRAN